MTDWDAEAREVAWRRALRFNVEGMPYYTAQNRAEFFDFTDVQAEVADIASLARRAYLAGLERAVDVCNDLPHIYGPEVASAIRYEIELST